MRKEDKERLICEPVRRPDGEVLKIFRYTVKSRFGNYDYITVSVRSSAYYDIEEVRLLGKGDLQGGIDLLGQAHYIAPIEDLRAGTYRLLNEEIKVLKSSTE